MMKAAMQRSLAAVFFLNVSLSSNAATGVQEYFVYPLLDIATSFAYGAAINRHGQIAGTMNVRRADGQSESHLFITGRNGHPVLDLGLPEGKQVQPLAMNAGGIIVGSIYTNGLGTGQPMITGPNGSDMKELRLFADQSSGHASSINDVGQVVGQVCRSTGGVETCNGFVTGPNAEGVTLLGSTEQWIYPSVINNLGQIAGSLSVRRRGKSQAFLTGPNQTDPIYSQFGPYGSGANVLNDSGDVAGYQVFGTALRVLGRKGPVQRIVPLAPYERTNITGMDARGRAGGYLNGGGFGTDPSGRAIIVDTRGRVEYLDEHVANLGEAKLYSVRSVNERGQMAISGSFGAAIACLTENCEGE